MAPRLSLARLGEWFWQGNSIQAARQEAAQLTPKQHLLIGQARTLFDLGERVRARITTVTAESSDATALLLFHEAATLALQSKDVNAEEAWAACKANIVVQAALSASAITRLDQIFPSAYSPHQALTELQQKTDADILERTLGVLLAESEAPYQKAEALRGLRFFRITVLVLAALAIAWGGLSGVRHLLYPPNLLEGKAWQASSTYPGFNVNRQVCDGKPTAIFFHTRYELNPWVQFDIGKISNIRQVQVRNRTDFESNRALPLSISLSQDGKKWTDVGRKSEAFTEWTLDFPPTQARYVRAQALGTTWLHLEWIKAH